MRVLMVNKYAHVTGGADRQALSLATALREAGHDVGFLSTRARANVEATGAFVPLAVSNETRDALPTGERVRVFRDAMWNRAAARAMRTLARDYRPDIVHSHKLYPQLSVAPVVIARRLGIPVVQTLHDYEFISASPLDAEGRRIDGHEQRLAYRALNTATFLTRRRLHIPAVSSWIAVSGFVAEAHRRRGIDAVVIPNFADVASDAEPTPLDVRSGVLFLGTLSVEKGVHDVVSLARAMPSVAVVIGGRGPLERAIVSAARSLPNLEFRGHLDTNAAAAAMRAARVVVTPSRWQEPGALVALEAMATGTPVVAYRRGGLSEYVSRAGAGLVVDCDPGQLTRATRELLEDDILWERCSRAGRASTRTIFGRDAHLAAVIAVYEAAMEKSLARTQ